MAEILLGISLCGWIYLYMTISFKAIKSFRINWPHRLCIISVYLLHVINLWWSTDSLIASSKLSRVEWHRTYREQRPARLTISRCIHQTEEQPKSQTTMGFNCTFKIIIDPKYKICFLKFARKDHNKLYKLDVLTIISLIILRSREWDGIELDLPFL